MSRTGEPSPLDSISILSQLRRDPAATAFLFIAEKQGTCSPRVIGRLVESTEYAWRVCGDIEPHDLEKLGLIEMERSTDVMSVKSVRITDYGRHTVEFLLRFGGDDIGTIKRAVDIESNGLEIVAFEKIYAAIGFGVSEPALMLLTTEKLAGKYPGRLFGKLSADINISSGIMDELASFGLLEITKSSDNDGSDFTISLTEAGQRVIHRLRECMPKNIKTLSLQATRVLIEAQRRLGGTVKVNEAEHANS